MPDKNQKDLLRQELLTRRQALEPEVRQAWDASLQRRLLRWWEQQPFMALGVYWPIRGEPDLRPAYEALAQRGVKLALPLVVAPASPLEFVLWAPGDELHRGSYGIAVPAHREPAELQALIIPCVGFTPENLRLGYGGGFYDRTLAVRPGVTAVGIAYANTCVHFDPAPHDIPLTAVLTN